MINRIIINEQDLTTINTTNIIHDVVYIPGFAKGGTQPARVPLLCTSVREFTEAFGDEAPTFASAQPYTSAFADIAIPKTTSGEQVNANMFEEGNADPSYLYALALLQAGLSVVYERINKVDGGVAVKPTLEEFAPLFETNTEYYENDYFKQIVEGELETTTTVYYRVTKDFKSTSTEVPSDSTEEVSEQDVLDVINALEISDTTVQHMYDAMKGDGESSIYSIEVPESLSEVSTYDIKYITSGGYPTFEYDGNSIVKKMLALAGVNKNTENSRYEGRGDAIALIDHTDNYSRKLTGNTSVFKALQDAGIDSSYGAMITPWATYSNVNRTMPGSFGYLLALARSLRTYPSWSPIAGVVRGALPTLQSLHTEQRLTNAVADSYQADPEYTSEAGITSMNAITYIKNQGYTVWGNRTLSHASNGFATLFLNMRSLICDVKKRAFEAAQKYMFEQNTDVLWLNFKNDVEQLLGSMASSNAIKRYKIVKLATENKTKIAARILIQPVYAVEKFEVTIIMTDTELSVIDDSNVNNIVSAETDAK